LQKHVFVNVSQFALPWNIVTETKFAAREDWKDIFLNKFKTVLFREQCFPVYSHACFQHNRQAQELLYYFLLTCINVFNFLFFFHVWGPFPVQTACFVPTLSKALLNWTLAVFIFKILNLQCLTPDHAISTRLAAWTASVSGLVCERFVNPINWLHLCILHGINTVYMKPVLQNCPVVNFWPMFSTFVAWIKCRVKKLR
jgi:hypothetical protein